MVRVDIDSSTDVAFGCGGTPSSDNGCEWWPSACVFIRVFRLYGLYWVGWNRGVTTVYMAPTDGEVGIIGS